MVPLLNLILQIRNLILYLKWHNDLFRDLDLSKRQAEPLTYRVHDWNLLDKHSKYLQTGNDIYNFQVCFPRWHTVFSNKIPSVVKTLKISYKTSGWRLLIDLPKVSFNNIKLQNGTKYPSAPMPLECVTAGRIYSIYSWKIFENLKEIAILLGLQLGSTIFFCFICEWDCYLNCTSNSDL